MAHRGEQYPTELNPFGDDETSSQDEAVDPADYPSHLDPFLNSDGILDETSDYPAHLDPFLNSNTANDEPVRSNTKRAAFTLDGDKLDKHEGNPFASDSAQDQQEATQQSSQSESTTPNLEESPNARDKSPELAEPPKPLPRTKSLLKKEQARKRRLEEQKATVKDLHNQTISLQSTTSSTTSSSSTSTTETKSSSPISAVGTFQRQKNKRLAPPVPINFKREVSGSLDAIEEELGSIGDRLAMLDKESDVCQKTLSNIDESVNGAAIETTRDKFIELIKRRNSIVRRQKELMYKRRELKLDQLHSDIEYELRMIGNKQLSTRTEEDEMREKDLLKKLVEIVEEKNDIVENLNKDTSCDSRDVEEAFMRLNLSRPLQMHLTKQDPENNAPAPRTATFKSDCCDKKEKGLTRLSKIATLLPKGNSIKIKRKRLFKKTCDSRPIER